MPGRFATAGKPFISPAASLSIVLLFVLVTAHPSAEDPELITFAVDFQGCASADHALLFDDEAREAFTECEYPLAGFTAYLNAGRSSEKSTTDDNGFVRLGPISIPTGDPVQLAVCKEDGSSCLNLSGGRAGKGWASGGDHFVLYRNGRLESEPRAEDGTAD